MAVPGWEQQQQQHFYAQQAYAQQQHAYAQQVHAQQLQAQQMQAQQMHAQQMQQAQQMQAQQMQQAQQAQLQMYGQQAPCAYQQQGFQSPGLLHQSVQDPFHELKQQLGIEVDEDQALGWIAEAAYDCPLPDNWECNQDPSTGRTYYVDVDMQSSSWEHPLLCHLRRIVEIGRLYRDSPWPSDTYFDDARSQLWEEQKEELLKWHGPFTNAEGREYYINHSSAKTMFRDPRIEAQHVSVLQQNFMANLEEELTGEPESPNQESPKNGDYWQSSNGAQVLTLEDDHKKASPGNVTPRLFALQQQLQVDHRSTFQQMTEKAKWLDTACKEEEEAQKLRLARLVEARKQRRKKKKLAEMVPLTGMELNQEPVPLRAEGVGT